MTDLASSKQISCHHVEGILKFPKSLMVILLYLFSFIKRQKKSVGIQKTLMALWWK